MQEKMAVVEKFNYQGRPIDIKKLGNGHINTTFKFTTSVKEYVLQQINTTVFPNVEELMSNIRKVTDHIACKHNSGVLVKAKNHKYYICHNGEYYRMYDLIDGQCINIAQSPKDMYLTGLGFGLFQKEMEDFEENLYEVIPDFHNTVKRYNAFLEAVEKDKIGRAEKCIELIREFKSYKEYCSIIVDKLAEGKLPYRVTHNDTKINNIIFDSEKNFPLCVIDLDTVMRGSALYDFGDAVRSGCNSSAEDEENLSRIYCKTDFFRALCRGFFVHTKKLLTEEEKKLLALSGIILTYECAMRFFTDYLNGDTYFKISKPDHNLIRSKAQLTLMKDMIKNRDKLEKIVEEELNGISLQIKENPQFFNLCNSESGESRDDTYFSFNHDKEKLYFCFKVHRMFKKSVHKEYNAPLYEGDIVELMLTLDSDNSYLEIEVNEFNTQYCVLIHNKDGKGDITISYLPESVIESEVEIIDDNFAQYFITVKKDDLRKLGWNGILKFNAHRQIFDDEGYLHLRSLNPIFGKTFHNTDAFIKAVLT